MGKKIYITESQFNNLVESKQEKKKKKKAILDVVKADRKARREEAREIYGDGFKPTTRVAKSDKVYTRKGKNKFKYGGQSDVD
jgi:hypothetical protein